MEERFRIDGPRFEIAPWHTKDYPDVFEAVPEPPGTALLIGDLRLRKALRSSGRAQGDALWVECDQNVGQAVRLNSAWW